MDEFEIVLVALFVAVAGLNTIARWPSVPYPIPLVLGGLVLGLLPGIPEIESEPELGAADLPAAVVVRGRLLLGPARAARRSARDRDGVGRAGIGDACCRRRGRARGYRAVVAAGLCAGRDRLADRSGRRLRDHAPARRPAPARQPPRGREPRERCDRARGLPRGRGRRGRRQLLSARRGARVRRCRRRRDRDLAGGRLCGCRDSAAARRRADRDHDLAADRLRGVHSGGSARALGGAGGGDRRRVPRLASARADLAADAPSEHRGLGDPRLPAQRHAVHPDRAAAAGNPRGRRRVYDRPTGRILSARLRNRDRCPLRLYVHDALRDPGDGSPAEQRARRVGAARGS